MATGKQQTTADMFTRITESLIRKRAEHNECMVSTLEEVALHQQNIGKIELLGQLCPKLKILYLQNNLISKLQNLHKLKVSSAMHVLLTTIMSQQAAEGWKAERIVLVLCSSSI
jgi:protein TilB